MKKNNTKSYFLIFFLWFIILIVFQIFSVNIKAFDSSTIYQLGGDTNRFLTLRDNIIDFVPTNERSIFYFGYSLFLVFFKIFNLNFNFVVLGQCIATVISAICLKKIYTKTGNKKPEIVLILFLFYIPIQMRNFFILSDSLFVSFSIITFYYFIKKKNFKNITLFLLISLFTFTIRPHGILMLILIIFYFYDMIPKKNKSYKYIFLILLSFCFLMFLNFYLSSTTRNYFYISGETIFGLKSYSVFYKNLPENLIDRSALYQVFYLFFNYPVESTKLLFYKIFFYISGIRPYYSLMHNSLEFFYTFSIFIIGITSYFLTKKNKIKNFMMMLIILSIIGSLITGPDWSGRYRMYIMPFIFIFASEFIENFLKKKFVNVN